VGAERGILSGILSLLFSIILAQSSQAYKYTIHCRRALYSKGGQQGFIVAQHMRVSTSARAYIRHNLLQIKYRQTLAFIAAKYLAQLYKN
jgi:hypothetical protein